VSTESGGIRLVVERSTTKAGDQGKHWRQRQLR